MINLKIPASHLEMSVCKISKEDIHNDRKYLYINLEHLSGSNQSYPAIFGTDVQLEHTKRNLCELFEITKIEELVEKSLWCIGSFNSIFGLVNPVNFKVFSLAQSYSISNYLEDLKVYKNLPEYKNINLEDEDLINLVCLNKCIKKLDPLLNNNLKIINDMSKSMLHYSLDSQLKLKNDNKPRIKI